MMKLFDVVDYDLRMEGFRNTVTIDFFGDCPYCGESGYINMHTYDPPDDSNHYVEVTACTICDAAVREDKGS